MPARNVVYISLMIAGVCLLLYGFEADTSRLQRIPTIVAGSFLFILDLAIMYEQAIKQTSKTRPNCQSSSNLISFLKILDWALILFTILLLPVFDLLALPPLIWIYSVVLPCLAARFIFTYLSGFRLSVEWKKKCGVVLGMAVGLSVFAVWFRMFVWFVNDPDRIMMDTLLTFLGLVILPILAYLFVYGSSAKTDKGCSSNCLSCPLRNLKKSSLF